MGSTGSSRPTRPTRRARGAPSLPPLLPEPRVVRPRPGRLRLGDGSPIAIPAAGQDDGLFGAAVRLAEAVERRCGLRLAVESHAAPLDAATPHVALAIDPDAAVDASDQGYRIEVDARAARVVAAGIAGLRFGLATLAQLVDARGAIPACEIEDAPDFAKRGIMLDVSRGKVPDEATLRGLVDLCAGLKLNVLMLYVEHTFRFRRHPRIGQDASPLDARTLRALDGYAAERGVELVPCLQSLGHMEHVLEWPEYAGLAETDLGWTISPDEPGTYALLSDLYAEFLPNFRSPLFNANCDEPWDLERGRSAARAAELGPGGVYLEHVRRIRDLAAQHGKRTLIWGDVVHAHPERIAEIPRDLVLLDWWYEASHIDFDRVSAFARAGLDFWVCPGTSSWNSLFPRVENSLSNIARWADAGRRHAAQGLLVTDWGDFGHYNLLGNSTLAFAWSAQQAWSGESPPRRFDRAFSRVLFGDGTGEVARLYRALGAIHDPGFAIFNGSALQYLFFDDVERSFFIGAAKPRALDRCESALERFLERLRRARGRFGEHTLTFDELEYAAEASLCAVRKARAGLEYDDWRRDAATGRQTTARQRRALARRLRDLADLQRALGRRFRRLWNARSAPSNIEMTLRRLSRSTRSLGAAARRLERNRPSPPPPAHDGFRPGEVLAELRRALPEKRRGVSGRSRGGGRARARRRAAPRPT